MSNTSILVSKRDGDWSTPSNVKDSPWHGAGFDVDAVTPSSIPSGPLADLGFVACIDHVVNVTADAEVGASYPSAGFDLIDFSATAGSVATRLPSGNYRACYATRSTNGISSVGNTESPAVLLTTGVSKPRVTFPAIPPTGLTYYLFLTAADGDSGSERAYALNISTGHVDLLTEDYNTDIAGHTDPVVESDSFSAPYARGIPQPTPYRYCSAITIGPEGSLRLAAGVTLTVRGDIWIEGKADGGRDYIVFEAGSRIVWDYSRCIIADSTEYTIWPAAGGRIRFKGPA